MVTRRPLALVNGLWSEVPVGDSLPTDLVDDKVSAGINGRKIKDPVEVVHDGTLVTYSGEQTIDGVLTSGSRVLVIADITPSNNGIWVTSSGAWTRAADANTAANLSNIMVQARSGTDYAGAWFKTGSVTNLGSDAVTVTQTGGLPTWGFGSTGLLGNDSIFGGLTKQLTVAEAKTMLDLSGTNTGDQTITLTGPVTGSGTGSFATTIEPDSITNAMIADMPGNTVKTNATAFSSSPSDMAFGANTFLARSSSGNIGAKTISDGGLTFLAKTLTPGRLNERTTAFTLSGTSESAVLATQVPANSLTAGTTIRVTMYMTTSNGNAITPRLRYGTAGNSSDTLIVNSTPTTFTPISSSSAKVEFFFTVRTTGASGTGYGGMMAIAGGSAVAGGQVVNVSAPAATINTTVASFFTVTLQQATAAGCVVQNCVLEVL